MFVLEGRGSSIRNRMTNETHLYTGAGTSHGNRQRCGNLGLSLTTVGRGDPDSPTIQMKIQSPICLSPGL